MGEYSVYMMASFILQSEQGLRKTHRYISPVDNTTVFQAGQCSASMNFTVYPNSRVLYNRHGGAHWTHKPIWIL